MGEYERRLLHWALGLVGVGHLSWVQVFGGTAGGAEIWWVVPAGRAEP